MVDEITNEFRLAYKSSLHGIRGIHGILLWEKNVYTKGEISRFARINTFTGKMR